MTAFLAARIKAVAAFVVSGVATYVASAIVAGTALTLHGLEEAAAVAVLAFIGVHQAPANKPQGAQRSARASAGFALLALIGAILLVIGVILIVAAAASSAHTFAPYLPGVILAAVGLVLLWVDGGLGYGRRTRL